VPQRELTFSSTRVPPGRRALRVVGIVAAVVATVLAIWLGVVALLWGYAWIRLGADDIPALSDEVTTLGPAGASAPADATTLLVTFTGPVDPTIPRESPLEGPVALVQFGGPREDPAVLTLPMDLPVSIDGLGERPLSEVQLEGGLDLMARAVADYSAVRIDHVVTFSVDALPRMVDAVAPLQVCGSTGCREVTGDDLRVDLAGASDADLVRLTGDVLQALGQRVDTRFVASSPLATRRLIDAIDQEVATDVSLRGRRALEVASLLGQPRRLDRDQLPLVVNPDTGAVVSLAEPAMVRFQHLQEGTPLTTAGQPQDEPEADLIDDVRVAVLNGAGVDGLAGRVRLALEASGYRIVGTDNAPTFDRERTVVNYQAGDDTLEFVAALLAEELGDASLEPVDRTLEFEGEVVDLLVTVGQDQDR
jgi:hypothetical protein